VQAAIWLVEYNSATTGSKQGNTLSVTSTDGAFGAMDLQNVINAAVAADGGAGQLISADGSQSEVYAAPEPGSFGLLGTGLVAFGMVGFALRRRRHGWLSENLT